MKYWIFSILTAVIAYIFGCLNTQVLASNFVFRTNLRRLGNAEVGRALAAFCLVLGRAYPSVYGFRGSYATAALVIGSMFMSFSVGAAVLLICVLITWATRYLALGTLAGGIVLAVAGVLVMEHALTMRLCVFIAVLVLIRTIPAVARITSRKEERLSLEKDISYKFDEKF